MVIQRPMVIVRRWDYRWLRVRAMLTEIATG
jgi:hypothetical protein